MSTMEVLPTFTAVQDVTNSVVYDVWMEDSEYAALSSFKADVSKKMVALTLLWAAVHVFSLLTSPLVSPAYSALPWKDKLRWHNKVVSLTHAVAAVWLGAWWLLASGEYRKTHGRLFGFFPHNADIAALGAAYFVYDILFCAFCAAVAPDRQLPSVLLHHAIFISAYATTLVYPCVLSVTTYHLFQLTELSTVFLHVTWMLSKTQAPFKLLYISTLALLATFLQRVVTTLFIVWHVATWIVQSELWSVKLPDNLHAWSYAYCGYFGVGSLGMLFLNWTWFNLLVARANDMIKRVQSGGPPTPDYAVCKSHKSE